MRPIPLFLVLLAVVLFVVIVESRPRTIGDSRHYVAMAQTFAGGRLPIYTGEELEAATVQLNQLGGFPTDELRNLIQLPDGRFIPDHFWVYSALAAPGVLLAKVFGAHQNYAFVVLNVVFFLAAAGLMARRFGVMIAALVFVSPLIWWIDKAHTEVFTVSLLAIAVASLPFWALAAIGLGASQNIAAAPLLLLAALAAFAVRRSVRDRQIWAGIGVAALLVGTHIGWYLALTGKPTSMITAGETFHLPTFPEAGAWLWDSNVSLVPYAPILVGAVIASFTALLLLRRDQLAGPETIFSIAAVAVLLLGFSQTDNVNSGGSFGPMRYTLWLMPLAIPLIGSASGAFGRAFDRAAIVPIALSCVLAVTWFRPIESEGRRLQPTWLADYIWHQAPDVENPLPEVFFERVAHVEGKVTSVAYTDCSKVLVIDGTWPEACGMPPTLPAECLAPAAACYANRTDGGYSVRLAPSRGTGP